MRQLVFNQRPGWLQILFKIGIVMEVQKGTLGTIIKEEYIWIILLREPQNREKTTEQE